MQIASNLNKINKYNVQNSQQIFINTPSALVAEMADRTYRLHGISYQEQ